MFFSRFSETGPIGNYIGDISHHHSTRCVAIGSLRGLCRCPVIAPHPHLHHSTVFASKSCLSSYPPPPPQRRSLLLLIDRD
jgi:hypothetical protein